MPNLSGKKQKGPEEGNIMRKERVWEGNVSISDNERRRSRSWATGGARCSSQLRILIEPADPRGGRGVEVGGSGVVSRRFDLYRRGVQNVVKMTFAKGAALEDPSGLFNSSLGGNTRRAIDFHEGEKIDEEALKALVRAAVTLNASHAHR